MNIMSVGVNKKTFISSVLVVSMAFSSLFFLPRHANAQLTSVIANCFGGGASAASAAAAATAAAARAVWAVPVSIPTVETATPVTAKATSLLEFKEDCLDGIAYMVAKIILRQMTQSIITWINTGFEGDPLFLTNPEQYFGNIANQELNRAIWEIQRYPNIFANQVVIALTSRTRGAAGGGYNLGQVITQQCLRQEAEQRAGYDPNDSSGAEYEGAANYLPGDATTRLAKAEEKRKASELAAKEKAENSIVARLARVKNFFKDSFAGVIVAQNNPNQLAAIAPTDQLKLLESLQKSSDTAVPSSNTSQILDTIRPEGVTPATPTAPGVGDAGGFDQTGFAGTSVISGGTPTNCPTTVAAQEARAAACSRSGILSFSQCGGWPGYYARTQICKNNAMCAILAAENKLRAQQMQKITDEKSSIAGAGGALSVKKCIDPIYDDEDGYEGVGRRIPLFCAGGEVTETPRGAVANALNEVTSSSLRQTELVNELGQAVDQILSAFFNQLITMGVRSLSDGSIVGGVAATITSGVAGSYMTQAQFNSAALSNINTAEISAQRYYVAKNETVSLLRDIVTSLNSLSSLGGVTGASCPLTINQASSDISKGSQYSALANAYEIELQALASDLATLPQIKSSAQTANDLTGAYYIASRLPSATTATAAETERNQTRTKKTEVEALIPACGVEKKAIDDAARAALSGGSGN
ncbi:MAG: hypothetical protein AAB507_01265, partial [Patescibacteria group bacterium]